MQLRSLLGFTTVCALFCQAQQASTAYADIITVDGVRVHGTLFNVLDQSGRPIGTQVDYVPFRLETGGTVTIDVLSGELDDRSRPPFTRVDVNNDSEFAYFDPYVFLFRNDGLLDASDYIAESRIDANRQGFSDGSVTLADPFLSVDLGATDYLLAVLAEPLSLTQALGIAVSGVDPTFGKLRTAVARPPFGFTHQLGHDHGDYQITFSDNVVLAPTTTVVPEPSTFTLLALGAIPVFAGLRRRKQSQS